jgi:hypothetical protein
MKLKVFIASAALVTASLSTMAQLQPPPPGKPGLPGGAALIGPGACAIPPGTPGVMNVSNPVQVRPNEIKFVDSVRGVQQSLWNRPGMGPRIVPSIACYGGRPVSPDGQDVSRIPPKAVCQMLTGNPAPGGGGAVKVISCNAGAAVPPAPPGATPPPGATGPGGTPVPPGAMGYRHNPAICALPDGTSGVQSVNSPIQIRPNEIKFVDSVRGPQQALWNRPGMGPGIVPSAACYRGRLVNPDGQDVSRIPGGASCKMVTGIPSPGGGRAVTVISCN